IRIRIGHIYINFGQKESFGAKLHWRVLPGDREVHYFSDVEQMKIAVGERKKSKAYLLTLPGKHELEAFKIVFPANIVEPPLHYHKCNILVQIYSGKVTVQTPNGVVPLQPGDFFFTPALCPHT